MRPYVLAGFCMFIITAVFFSRAVAQASKMDILMAQRRASLLERRYVEDGLMDINTAGQADAEHEAVLQVPHATVEAHPLTKFASTKDELLALISVGHLRRSIVRADTDVISSSLLPLPMPFHPLIPSCPSSPRLSSILIHPGTTRPKTLSSSRPRPTPSTRLFSLAKCVTHGIERSKKSWPNTKSLPHHSSSMSTNVVITSSSFLCSLDYSAETPNYPSSHLRANRWARTMISSNCEMLVSSVRPSRRAVWSVSGISRRSRRVPRRGRGLITSVSSLRNPSSMVSSGMTWCSSGLSFSTLSFRCFTV